MDQENVMSDWKLNRMKKSDIIALLRETEEKLLGIFMLEEAVKELEWKLADEEGKNKKHVKTINELNESNKKLMEKIKFYQDQKENNKKKDNKVADYVNNGLVAKIESLEAINKNLEKEKEELIQECKTKCNWNEALEEEVQKWKEQVEENYKHHYDQFEPVLLENEKLKKENKQLEAKVKLGLSIHQNHLYNLDEIESYIDSVNECLLNLRKNDEKLIIEEKYPTQNGIDPLVNKFINEKCEEVENDTSGDQEIAPTELDNLYCDFKEWCSDTEDINPIYMKRNKFKENLKIWQANSRFGLDIGQKKSDAGMNGYEAKPRFNLKVI